MQPTDPFVPEKPRIEPSIVPSVPNVPSRFSKGSGSDFSQCWRNALNRVSGESRTSGVPARSTFRRILATPTAERIKPSTNAAIPRIRRSPKAFDSLMFDPIIEKQRIARVGGNAYVKRVRKDRIDEIEPKQRNRKE